RRKEQQPEPMPFVFLSACESAAGDPDDASSLIELLLANRNRAILGAETIIPDDLAALFAKFVYIELARGATLGLAAYRARWQILERYDNPVGILFSLFGNPDLRLEPRG